MQSKGFQYVLYWVEHVTVPVFPDRHRSRKSGPNSVGAGADFRSRDRIYNGINLKFGIKYYIMHEKVGAFSEDAGDGAFEDRSQPGRSRSCKDQSQIC